MSMIYKPKRGPMDRASLLEGVVEIWAYSKGQLFDYQRLKNIVLFQGNAEVIRTLCSVDPITKPRVITRMAVGDQGTIPSDSTIPKVPVKTATALYHEVCRKDVENRIPTLYTPLSFTYTGHTTNGSTIISNLSSTVGIVAGMTVSGTGIPAGSVVVDIVTANSISISLPATSTDVDQSISFAGTVNECQFVATFTAADVPLTAFANPSQPRINEVGLIIIDPTAEGGLVRATVFSPDTPDSDEVLMTLRTFKSVPFEAASDTSITIRYTIFTE